MRETYSMTGLKQVSVRKIWMTRHRSGKNDKTLRENRKEEKPYETQACCLGYERINSFYPIDWIDKIVFTSDSLFGNVMN